MSKQADKSLFMVSSRPALYQQLLTGAASYEAFGGRIIKQIKAAKSFRKAEIVKELAGMLLNSPIREHQIIAQYYFVWCECRRLHFQSEALDAIIGQTNTFKVKALSSRGTFEWYKGNNESAMFFYSEALRASPTVSEFMDLSKAIAVLKSQEGFHKSAMKDLENLLPIIRYAEPIVYYEFLNSYAVELGEAGRIEEAQNVCRITLASPFAFAYPEWLDTPGELAQKRARASRSIVAGSVRVSGKVLRHDWSVARARQVLSGETKAEVRNITDRNRFEMPKKERKKEKTEDYAHLEKRAELHLIIADPDTTGEELAELLKLYKELKGKRTEQK